MVEAVFVSLSLSHTRTHLLAFCLTLQMVREFSEEDRCRFLQFATGTSRVPATGFKDLWGTYSHRKSE
jgi:hypothetical protein